MKEFISTFYSNSSSSLISFLMINLPNFKMKHLETSSPDGPSVSAVCFQALFCVGLGMTALLGDLCFFLQK